MASRGAYGTSAGATIIGLINGLVEGKNLQETIDFPIIYELVGGLEAWNFMTFHSVGNGIIIPTDELHHFSEG